MIDFFTLDPDLQAERLKIAGHTALQQWGIEAATLDLIKYRENAVFKVERDGEPLALRMHRHGYHSDAELRSELQWMQALNTVGIHTPIVIPTQTGDLFVSVAEPGLPGAIQVDLFEWIDGQQLGSVEEGIADERKLTESYDTIGQLAAKVHNQATTWAAPDGFVRHAWDANGLAGSEPFWGRFWELEAATTAERDLLVRSRDRVLRDLSAFPQTADTYSMIHADFAPENLLVNGNTVRLIDFDDAGFGWHLFELATALYFIADEPYFEQAKAALISGYRKHRPLSDEHLANLPLFMLARGLTYVGWVHTRHETETAKELTPMLLEAACGQARSYLGEN